MSEDNSKILEFFRKIGDAFLGLRNLPSKIKNVPNKLLEAFSRPSSSRKREIPSFMENFFENRSAGWAEYVVLKIQLAILILFAFVAVFVFSQTLRPVSTMILMISTGYLGLTYKSQLKEAFQYDYYAYRAFITICIILAWVAVSLFYYFPPIFANPTLNALTPAIIILVLAIVSFALFRIKYGREHTYGQVKEVKDENVKVKTKYDIRSNTKPGEKFLKTITPVKKGDIVKISVKKPLLGLKGSEKEKITEKASEKAKKIFQNKENTQDPER